MNFFSFYPFKVFFWRKFICIILIFWNTAAGYNCPQIMSFTYFLPGIVQPSSYSHSAVLRMYKKVNAVQHITLRIMRRKCIVARYLCVGMIVAKLLVSHNQG